MSSKRESLKLQEADWKALERLARTKGCTYAGRPSWRRLILRLARGEVRLLPGLYKARV